MPRIYTSVDQKTIDLLTNIQNKKGISFSKAVSEMISVGLENSTNIEDKHSEYLLRTMNICSEILRCVYDKNKVSFSGENTEDALQEIKQTIQNYVKS